MKTYSNLYGNKMVLFFFQYEIDFFFIHISKRFFLSNIANEMRIIICSFIKFILQQEIFIFKL